MIKLYFSPYTRSHLVRFTLEELEVPYELVRLDVQKGEHKAPDYLRVHPLGVLPAIEDDGQTILECGAICMHLADKTPAKRLAPALGARERATYTQWMFFAFATELFALSKIAMHTRFLPEPMRVAAIAEDGYRAWPDVAKMLSSAVHGKKWLLGDQFTTADVACGGSLWLANLIGVLGDYPELRAYHERVAARPAFERGFALDGT
jgi:glutathione S-transferase